jgi:hypothetical protein
MYTELLAAAEDCAVGEREPIKQRNGLRRDARGFSGRHIVHSSPGHRGAYALLVIGLAKASTLLVDPRKFGHLEAGLNAHDPTTSHLSPKVRKTRMALS